MMEQDMQYAIASAEYHPRKRQEEILNWCLQKINTVPYRVPLRWAFYRAYDQFGWKGKDMYKKFIPLLSKARKSFWNGWTPYTLVDDTRAIAKRGWGYPNVDSWIASLRNEQCVIDKRQDQDQIIIICFEAAAMASQFEYYTKDYFVSLFPFHGDVSVDGKWRLAKWIEELYSRYHKKIHVPYFGDLDKKGQMIPESAMKDVRAWCNVPFEYTHIGLKPEHIKRFNIPANPERPGEYQWESLDDWMAKELILGELNRIVKLDKIQTCLKIEEEGTQRWKGLFDEIIAVEDV